jgi:hypothetical protein
VIDLKSDMDEAKLNDYKYMLCIKLSVVLPHVLCARQSVHHSHIRFTYLMYSPVSTLCI